VNPKSYLFAVVAWQQGQASLVLGVGAIPTNRFDEYLASLYVMKPRQAVQPIARNHQIEVAMPSDNPSPVNSAA
jgi:hypothetical protein